MSYIESPGKLRGISLITSCGCNLNCSYCRIAQSVNENSKTVREGTIQALQNGEYIKNVRDVIYKIGESPLSIDSIAFWGQEPTLTLHHVTDHLEEWRELFPNWQNTMFSTNTVAHLDRVVDFIDKMDTLVKKPFHLQVQLSYDGDYSTDTLRGVEHSIIYQNVHKMIETLNQKNYKFMDVNFNFHGVLSLDLLNKLQDSESIYKYMQALGEWGLEFYMLSNNKHIRFSHSGVDISLENPVNAAVDEGIKLANFCNLSERIKDSDVYSKHFENCVESAPRPHLNLCSTYYMLFDHIEKLCREVYNIHNFNELMERIVNDEALRRNLYQNLNPELFCGNGVSEVKIMYDGTLVNCQNHIYETDANFIKDEGDLASSVKKALATHNYFINPLTASDYEMRKYFHLFNSCKFHSLEFIFKTTLTSMQYLVLTNQIDKSYNNIHKLVSHAFLVSLLNVCSYNNQIMTGSLFLRNSGFLRLLCNGFMDYVIDEYNKSCGPRGFVF